MTFADVPECWSPEYSRNRISESSGRKARRMLDNAEESSLDIL